MLDFGEEPMPLKPGEYALEVRSDRLWIEAWTDDRTLSRRIISVDEHATGVLDCSVHRFGGTPAKLTFLDLERPQTAHRRLSGTRRSFGEQFRRMLTRQFPGWEIATLTTGMDLQRSFSPVFPRARLLLGGQQIAAMACPSLPNENELLTFALLWFHHLRRADRSTSLALFLPETAGCLTAHRLRWLDSEVLRPRLFRFNEHGSAGEVDAEDLGNLDTRVAASGEPVLRKEPLLARRADEYALEGAVRSTVKLLAADLLSKPVHSQVISFGGLDRDAIDLLAMSDSGRLCVIELKATEDIHLPIQALDYWVRTNWHAERGELAHLFPGIPIAAVAAKLMLVAPALAFHPANATVLRYFRSCIDVERIGVNSNWENELRVVLRLRGADGPQSHGSSYEYSSQSPEYQEGDFESQSGTGSTA